MPPLAAAAEIAGEAGAGEAAAGAGAEGAGGLGGMLKEFNDMPGLQIAGSVAGKLVHAAMGAIGTHGGEGRPNEGPLGTIA